MDSAQGGSVTNGDTLTSIWGLPSTSVVTQSTLQVTRGGHLDHFKYSNWPLRSITINRGRTNNVSCTTR